MQIERNEKMNWHTWMTFSFLWGCSLRNNDLERLSNRLLFRLELRKDSSEWLSKLKKLRIVLTIANRNILYNDDVEINWLIDRYYYHSCSSTPLGSKYKLCNQRYADLLKERMLNLHWSICHGVEFNKFPWTSYVLIFMRWCFYAVRIIPIVLLRLFDLFIPLNLVII